MKAVVFDRCGGPEVLELREVPEPAIRADEALVEVRACGINHLDLWVRRGLPGLEVEMPHILGNEVVGVVAACGEAVRHLKPGDRVLVNPTLSCGVCAQCLAGDDNLCRDYDVIGRRRNGGYAEKVAVPGVNCLPFPENLKWEEAAAVIATAGSEAKLERARAFGVHEALLHSSGDLAVRVRALTGKKGVEVVLEHVGGAMFESAVAALARNGRLVTCGATAASTAQLDLNLLFGRHLALLGSWMGRRAELVEVLRFVRDGRLRPVVDSVMPLAEARRAHERIEAREHFGKVVLVP